MADNVAAAVSRQMFDEAQGSEHELHPTTAVPSPVPIFVLGLQRSGTTWVANMLGAHSQVACVESEDHHGVHESVFFSHFARAYGDLGDEGNFRRFATDFAASDYYVLTGVEEGWLWRRRPASYAAAFRDLMDEMAHRRGARFWVEKSPHHTLLCRQLARDFPDARFVCVVRESLSRVRSLLWGLRRKPPSYPGRIGFLLTACAANDFYSRTLERFTLECDRSILVRYEELVRDVEGNLRRIAEFSGVPLEAAMLKPRFAPNSSFRSAQERDRALGAADRALICGFALLLRVFPLPLLRRFNVWRNRRDRPTWPAWVWRRRDRGTAAAGSLRAAR
ncbi:MAG: sulfotransferase family protein [Dongiaceae bacterium]